MKIFALHRSMVVCLAATVLTSGVPAWAAKPEKSYTGIVNYVDPKDHMLETLGAVFGKEFNLSPNCKVILPDHAKGTINDLRPGENVTVSYRDASGVLIVDRVEQHLMCFTGIVDDIDYGKPTITVYSHELDRSFNLASHCPIILRNGKPGVFTNLQTGNQVLVTYEKPDGTPTARRIEQTSQTFTGTLKALDLMEGTLKARARFNLKSFTVAKNCTVVIHGQNAHLSDLKPNDRLVFSYDEIKGVSLVNRIVPVDEVTNAVFTDEYAIDP